MSHTYDDKTVTIRLTLEVDADTDVQALAAAVVDALVESDDPRLLSIMVVIDAEVEK